VIFYTNTHTNTNTYRNIYTRTNAVSEYKALRREPIVKLLKMLQC